MIEARGLTKRYGDVLALDDVSFEVGAGEVVGFLGPNGAGKTTTMRILTGFLPASDGTARIAGYDIHESPREARVLQILYCGAASPKSEYRQTSATIHQRQQDDVADWVRAGQAAGSIRASADPKSIAAQYIAYISGMTYLWLINPTSIDFRKANDDMKVHLKISLSPNQSDQ